MNDPIQRTMVKKVKIHAPIAIKTVNPTIYGDIAETTMSPANIMKCLIGRATVWEILSDGSLLKMNEHNYNTINKPMPKVAKTSETLAKDVDHSAIATDEEQAGYKTMVLKDKVTVEDKVDIAPDTVEDLNKKVEDAGEIPAPKAEEPVKDEDVVEDTTDTKPEMTDEERELAELEAQINALDEEKKKNK